jgi:glycosyltransferase involved in cell wall biosynthesis
MQGHEYRQTFEQLLADTRGVVTMVGQYAPAELPRLMEQIDWVVVPSIWWENSPLVIQEAFAHGKPVICSDIGGMAEKVTHGVNGLHFRVGDPSSLADVLREAVSTPGLWERLRAGIPPVHRMDEHVARLGGIYSTLLDERRAGKEAPCAVTAG